MNSLKQVIGLMFVLCITCAIISCNKSKAPKMVMLPFETSGIGEYKFVGPDTLPDVRCTGRLSAWRAIVKVTGKGIPVGSFTVHFDFCGDTLGNYGNIDAYLIAETGDTLFLSGSGQVIDGRLESHPEHVVSYWKDTFRISGGTGIYDASSGVLVSDDYNSSEDMNSHHNWTGTLTMKVKK